MLRENSNTRHITRLMSAAPKLASTCAFFAEGSTESESYHHDQRTHCCRWVFQCRTATHTHKHDLSVLPQTRLNHVWFFFAVPHTQRSLSRRTNRCSDQLTDGTLRDSKLRGRSRQDKMTAAAGHTTFRVSCRLPCRDVDVPIGIESVCQSTRSVARISSWTQERTSHGRHCRMFRLERLGHLWLFLPSGTTASIERAQDGSLLDLWLPSRHACYTKQDVSCAKRSFEWVAGRCDVCELDQLLYVSVTTCVLRRTVHGDQSYFFFFFSSVS